MNLMKIMSVTEKSRTLQNKNLLSHIKLGKDILMLGRIEIEKKTFFYFHKSLIFKKVVFIEKVLVSDKILFAEKLFEWQF